MREMRVKEKTMLEIMLIKRVGRRDLMRIAGVSESMLCHVIHGRRQFNLRQTKRLIEFFGAELMSRAIDWRSVDVSNPL